MLAIDLRAAVEHTKADNFTTLLFRLMLKADRSNLGKLAEAYPVEAEMVEIFHGDCPYKLEKDELGQKQVDYDTIESLARARMAGDDVPS